MQNAEVYALRSATNRLRNVVGEYLPHLLKVNLKARKKEPWFLYAIKTRLKLHLMLLMS